MMLQSAVFLNPLIASLAYLVLLYMLQIAFLEFIAHSDALVAGVFLHLDDYALD